MKIKNNHESDNQEQNICKFFHALAQFPITKSDSELDYYHEEVNVGVASRVAERLKTLNLRKLVTLKKISEKL